MGGMVAASVAAAAPKVVEAAAGSAEDLTQYVKISIGTGGFGHTFPAATVPFGAVQLGPDTGDRGWKHCSGYHFDDKQILGFSHTRLSGTGWSDMLDFRVSPGYSVEHTAPARAEDFVASFSHADEQMEPGYYAVKLGESGIFAEFTATERTGFHRYTFAKANPCLLFDLQPVWRNGEKKPGENSRILWSTLKIGRDSLSAARSTDGWAKGREIYSRMEFSKPFSRVDVYQDGKLVEGAQTEFKGGGLMCVLHFEAKPREAIQVKLGISGVSTSGAENNLKVELPGWDFQATRQRALAKWQKQLSLAVATTSDLRLKQMFYTGLYHMMLAPTLFDDVDGRCMGMDGKIHTLPAGVHNYSTFSQWDTYRALHPFFTLVLPERVPDIVGCIIRQCNESPDGVTVWPLQGKETACMDGYHSAAIVAEAMIKGFPGLDVQAAYKAFRKRAEEDDYLGLAAYRRYGYVPCDVTKQSASRTCNYAYDDWCVAAIAEAAGDSAEAAKLRLRSKSYQNVYDHVSGFIRPRYADGHWAAPFDPKAISVTKKWRDYEEANGWQTTFLVQHDGPGLAAILGGKAALAQKLDDLFHQSSEMPADPDMPPDITGMVGQYSQGNEPCHHVAYFYNVAGVPRKTQQRVHQLMTEMYGTNPDDGMSGNEDCGQMSAWFCMSALGFYPVDPVSGQYDIGTPLFDRMELRVGGGKTLSIEAQRESPGALYVKSVTLNGEPQTDWKLKHRDLTQGGRLVFTLVEDSSLPPIRIQKAG
jgi:predicted alpha-1,2-mannosidase